MNKQTEAMKLALKRAFQYGVDHWYQADHDSYIENKKADETLAQFRKFVDKTCKALTAPVQQEPVAVADGTFNHNCPVGTPLYTSPPAQRKPLTDEEIMAIGRELGLKCKLGGNPNIDFDYTRAIEAAHGIKGEA